MKILSWDVGIKNLAYCLLKKDNDKFIILKWGIINLVDDRETCDYTLRNGRVCGGIGRYKMFDEKLSQHVTCTTHKDKYMPTIIKSGNCECEKCGKDSEYALCSETIGWCEAHYEKLSKKSLTKFKPKKISGQDCNKQPIQVLAHKLFEKLDEFPEFLTADEVLVENQPSLLNPTMKTISAILYSYFVMRGITDKEKTKSTIKTIKFTSPTNKLDINKGKTKKELQNAKSKRNKYEITKGLGKIYCERLIESKDLKILNEHVKKDDICDAFLQGFHHMFEKIPDEYVEKLENIPDNMLVTKKKTKSSKKKVETKNDKDNETENIDAKDKDTKDEKRPQEEKLTKKKK